MEQNKITREQAEAAAEWWANACESPKFDNLGPTRGNDPVETRQNDMASVFAMLLSAQKTPPGGHDLDAFSVALTEVILEKQPCGLHCDYGPDSNLSEAATRAGFGGEFPWKTNMWFDKGKVRVSHGYGAPDEIVYEETTNA